VLLRAVHSDWTPGQIKSALMTTSITDVVKENLSTPADPFDFGAGRIDIGEASLASITFDETAENFFALANDPVNAVHLNIPSVNAPVMPGQLTTTRVATNTSGRTEQFDVTTQAPEGTSITVNPSRFTIEAGESRTLTITIESDAPTGEQEFGQISLSSRRGEQMHLPVAFIPTQGSVNLVQTCSPETVQRGGVSTCTVEAANNSFEEQTVDLDTTVNDNLRIVGTDGAQLVDARHAQLHDVTLAGAHPGIPAVDPGALFGYVPLDAFPTTLEIPVGDEEIVNLSGFGAIQYNGQSWTSVGVDSNGYVILGPASSEDNNCCNLPDGPDPGAPNNMVAPFWTDLDGTGAEGILANVLSTGPGNAWLVVEYRVFVFGTNDLRTFQVWMGLGPTQDITFAYPAPQADPNGQDFLVGAENFLGEGDMEAVLPTEDLRVASTDFVPGDTVSYTVDVRGQRVGVGVVTTELEASRSPGVVVVDTEVRVTE
jgi:hypothetical protein